MKTEVATTPSRNESIAAIAVLGMLLCIAVAVYFVHLDFNPAVELVVTQSASRQDTGSPGPQAPEPILKPPAGVKALSDAEIFRAHNLADKINGKAAFYLSAGFAELNCQRFVSRREPDLWAEVFVYRMTSTDAAFAVFSGQRREGVETLAISRHAYLADNAVFLARGPLYAEIIAPEVTPESRELLLALAESVVGLGPDSEAGSKEALLFAPEGLDPGSIQLLATDVFGFKELNSVYIADFKEEDTSLTAFVSRRTSPQEARALAQAYGDFLIQFGGRQVTVPRPFEAGQVIEIMDTYEVIFTSGVYLAGVHEADSRDAAEQLAHRLMRHLSRLTDGS